MENEGFNRRGARTVGYLRSENEFPKRKSGTRSVIYISERMDTVKKIVPLLLEDSRMPLTEISKRTGIPVSTVYDNLHRIREAFKFTIVPKSDIHPCYKSLVLTSN